MTDPDARLLALLADRYDDTVTLSALAPALRRIAGRLAACRCHADPGGCPVDGRPVDQPARGRRRVYCSPRCRRRAEQSRRNASVAS